MIKNIIFDWSGVINDNTLTVYKVIIEMFKRLGIREISLDEFRKEWKLPYMLFFNKYLPDLTLEKEQKLYKEVYQEQISKNPPKAYSGIIESLKKFYKSGIKMVVLSGDLKETIFKEIRNFGVEKLFEDVVFMAYDKKESINDLIKRNNFDQEETIFIGDTCHEIEAGKGANVITGAVIWGFDPEDKLKSAEPDYIIHNLKELEDIILKHD